MPVYESTHTSGITLIVISAQPRPFTDQRYIIVKLLSYRTAGLVLGNLSEKGQKLKKKVHGIEYTQKHLQGKTIQALDNFLSFHWILIQDHFSL